MNELAKAELQEKEPIAQKLRIVLDTLYETLNITCKITGELLKSDSEGETPSSSVIDYLYEITEKMDSISKNLLRQINGIKQELGE